MNDQQTEAMLRLLSEIRDNQSSQIELQNVAINIQKEQFGLYKTQYDRAEKINLKSEQLLDKGASLQDTARKIVYPLLVIVVLYIIYLAAFRIR